VRRESVGKGGARREEEAVESLGKQTAELFIIREGEAEMIDGKGRNVRSGWRSP
jgi:hypothetical protein